MSMRIGISGATGFVGSALGTHLFNKNICVRGLTRRVNSQPSWAQEWLIYDPMNMESLKEALKGVDVAVYLIHSMMTPAIYTQGGFCDLDRLLAHNFARAARLNNVKKIVYLGGIVPRDGFPISKHLGSRKEVEEILSSYGTPVIALRAGIIVGPGGPSLDLLCKVVKRFPVMLCPYWTQSLSAPIDLKDLLCLLEYAIMSPEIMTGYYDVGGSESLTYLEMMKKTARLMGLKRILLPIPFFYETLSAYSVSLVTQIPIQLVSPLMESLRHNVLPDNTILLKKAALIPRSFTSSLEQTLRSQNPGTQPIRTKCLLFRKKFHKRRLCSVQTYPLPADLTVTAYQMSVEYAIWLGQLIPNLLKIKRDSNGDWMFYFGKLKKPLMILKLNQKSLDPNFIQYTISHGLLVGNTEEDPGRMEFHIIKSPNVAPKLVIGVLDFCSPMPWLLYRSTQAQFHKVIMWLFKIHIHLKSKRMRKENFSRA